MATKQIRLIIESTFFFEEFTSQTQLSKDTKCSHKMAGFVAKYKKIVPLLQNVSQILCNTAGCKNLKCGHRPSLGLAWRRSLFVKLQIVPGKEIGLLGKWKFNQFLCKILLPLLPWSNPSWICKLFPEIFCQMYNFAVKCKSKLANEIICNADPESPLPGHCSKWEI